MQFTDEQHAAITIQDRNLIVTAGAGSGKTRVLVERFMALLDANADWTLPSIVAITFTEKAAGEMRDRVREAIESRIQHAVADDDSAALDRWIAHQADLTRARIGTIHSLCARILRNNPAEARIDPAFDMLDENEAAIVLDDAVDEALAILAAEDRPGTALLAAYGVGTARAVLRQYAFRGASAAVGEGLLPYHEDMIAKWRDAWESATRDLLTAIRADRAFVAALDFVRPGEQPPGDKLSPIWETVHAHTDALLHGSSADFAASALAVSGAIKLGVGSAANWGDKETLATVKDALRTIRERLQAALDSMLPPIGDRDEEALAWLDGWHDAIRLAAEVYAERKTARTALDFDDLETLARDLLNDHPAVAARYADEFKHILVDEFQDTNRAQRDIVYALAGVGEPGAEGRLFVVGDPKQSIYAFRGADVTVFGSVRAELVASGGAELPLSMSFRTHHNLVEAFNALFGHILGAEDFGYEVGLGTPMRAFRESDPAVPDHAQPLTVFAFPRPDRDVYPAFGADDMRRWEAWRLAHYIHDLVQQATPIFDRATNAYRPMTYGDVAILFQAMTRAPLYEEVFKVVGLPYVTVAGKGYYDRQEVWDLLNLLRALHTPADDLALAVALRSPLFGLSDDALFALRMVPDRGGDPLPLWRSLFKPRVPYFPDADRPARDFARGVLCDLRDLAGRVPVADLLSRALDLTGYLATLTGLSDGARRRGNVEKLVALARESGRVSLGSFLAYARDLTAREVREGEAVVEVEGAVMLMSVHASKGLEFPVVILADASWSRSRWSSLPFTVDRDAGAACRLPTDDPDSDEPDPFAWDYAARLADQRDQAERRRLLYVGATRAQDYLIVSGSLHRCPREAWLAQWIDALGILDEELAPDDGGALLNFEWGRCALHVPLTVTLPDHLVAAGADGSAWDDPAFETGARIAGAESELPPLLAEVQIDPAAPARALSVSNLEQLGRAQFYDPAERGQIVFRHAMLHDAPDPVRPLPDDTAGVGDLLRIVGEIVHRALQAWALPDRLARADLAGRLRTYAWGAGLSDEGQITTAVDEAVGLLHQFAISEVRGELDRAQQVYREVPFVYRSGERTIHGLIDVLYFDRNQWTVMDYKTAAVDRAWSNAKRYYLQVGMYAQAVEARTGQVPTIHLYYIHPARLITIRPDDWQPALDRLEDDLRAALAGQ
jgi:ATP-dependent helicase/nuclease subunit A